MKAAIKYQINYIKNMLLGYYGVFLLVIVFIGFIVDFLLSFSLYLALSGLGYFIGILIYRLNKVGKVLVCVGAYTIPFIIVPLLDYWFFDMKLSAGFANMVSFLFGSDTGNPLPAILSFISIGIILFALCWLLIRKSVIGDKK